MSLRSDLCSKSVITALYLLLISAFLIFRGGVIYASAHGDVISPCKKLGWHPTEFGLKDHHIFWYDGYYYLVSIYVPPGNSDPLAQDRFAYARSVDLCEWENLSPILLPREPGALDEAAIWAPYVHFEKDTYYLYYTGVTNNFTQSILLATTTDPSDPDSWQQQPMFFQPDHPDMLWEFGQPSDCRDPTVKKIGQVYYLYYTGRDISGSIIGLATATSPTGPWTDWGSVVPPDPTAELESPTIAQYANAYYLFYNRSGDKEYYRIGASPAGPWHEPLPFQPGWAHEIWQGASGEWFTSYLEDLTVTITPLSWDSYFSPPHPSIGSDIYRSFLPLVESH